MVDDNYHYQDEDERSSAGGFKTYAEALKRAQRIVLDSLRWEYQPGMTPEKLYDQYQTFGDDPFIVPEDSEPAFSAWNYAKSMCASICDEQSKIKKPPASK